MFPPSSPNCCDDNLNPFDSIAFTTTASDIHQNPNYCKQDQPFLFNLPAPFFDEDELPLNQIFLQTHLMAAGPDVDHKAEDDHQPKEESTKSNCNKMDHQPVVVPGIVRRRNLGVVPRRRTGKKDRHSKICTAQGIRDRRMRLSLQVARKFFDLQDMLGYDKASKTIEWLFTKSKKAIKELVKGCNNNNNPQVNIKASNGDAKNEYFLSECEVVPDPAANLSPSICIDPKSEATAERKSEDKTSTVKDSRDKARARARCRAKEKMIIKKLEGLGDQRYKSNHNLQKLGFSNVQFNGGDHDQQPQERISPIYSAVFSAQELSDLGTIDKLLVGNSGSTLSTPSCPLSDYDAAVSGYVGHNGNINMGFSGNNWDVLNSDKMNSIDQYVYSNQVQLADNPNSIYLATANFP